jgi:uncharacterized protein involved in exopolysaccharide biosynthesis
VEEEIDLRPYVKALVQNWFWIVGTAVFAGIITFILSSFIPPNYEATALVAVIEARDVVQFDARIRGTESPQPLNAFPQLALSDQILREVLGEVQIEGVDSVEQLRERLNAEAGSDATLIELIATSQSPTEAANVVNEWAAIFVNWANYVYGNTNQEQVQFFEAQLIDAEAELAVAEEALIEYQAVNQHLLTSNSLDALSLSQVELLSTKYTLARLEQDAQALRSQLETYVGNIPVTLAEQLTTLFLQMKTFNPAFDGGAAVPIQFQLDMNTPLTSQDRAEQIAFLDNLLVTIGSQTTQVETELAGLEPQLLLLQQQKQEAETKYNRLLRDQTVAGETYIALAHKVEEERITSADTNSGARLASEAAVPRKPVDRSRLVVAAIAVFAGLIVSSAIVFVFHWFQHEQQEL